MPWKKPNPCFIFCSSLPKKFWNWGNEWPWGKTFHVNLIWTAISNLILTGDPIFKNYPYKGWPWFYIENEWLFVFWVFINPISYLAYSAWKTLPYQHWLTNALQNQVNGPQGCQKSDWQNSWGSGVFERVIISETDVVKCNDTAFETRLQLRHIDKMCPIF